MELSFEQSFQFDELTKAMMEWIDKNCHPHCTIIITAGNAELVEGVRGNVNKNLRD